MSKIIIKHNINMIRSITFIINIACNVFMIVEIHFTNAHKNGPILCHIQDYVPKIMKLISMY